MQTDQIWVELTDAPICVASLQSKLTDPDVGAHGWFLGVTRRRTGDKVTESLAYEAHRPMAVRELSKLAEAAIEKFGLTKILIVHRLGEVPVGEASVAMACCSPHRVATFDALPWAMNILKRDVPIWKREHYQDGSTEWVHPGDQSP